MLSSCLTNFDDIKTLFFNSAAKLIYVIKKDHFHDVCSSILVLYLLQFLVTKYASISPQFSSVILSDPRIVFYQGQFLPEAMRAERLTRQEIECAMRAEGINNFDDIEAVVFESDAKLSVIPKPKPSDTSDDSQSKDRSVSETLKPLM